MTEDNLLQVHARMYAAEKMGWKFEDTGLTPGIPLLGCRSPDGEIAGVIGYCHYQHHADDVNKRLDELGVPK